jgi:hypothetical protein
MPTWIGVEDDELDPPDPGELEELEAHPATTKMAAIAPAARRA